MGARGLGRPSTTTASGTSWAGPTTRSRSPASAWGPRRSSRSSSSIPPSLEAAAVGIPDELKGQALACFCVAAAGLRRRSPALVEELRALVVERLGKPLRPSVVLVVPDLPKTRNAKVMRRVIRAAYLGENLGDLTSLENPRAVDAIVAIRNALRG